MRVVADGVVLPQTAFAETRIPDQRALLCWSNGVERLVIETRFAGNGTNFAWVVPLPNQPEIEAATPGLFPTLTHLLRPKVVHNPPPLFAGGVFCTAMGYLLLFVRAGRESIWDFVACGVAGLSLLWLSPPMAVFSVLLLLWAVVRVRQGREKPYAIVLVLLLGMVPAGMLLPALATAGKGVAMSGAVTELTSQRVGAFDTKTITAKNPKALLDWLRENQFAVPTNAEPIVADYLNRGWVFVAAKLHRDDASLTTNSIHPLSFTFRSEQPVYPLRLTGLNSSPVDVELYVFGDQRADAEHFETVRCAPVVFPQESPWSQKETKQSPVPVVHPTLREWTSGGTVVTKLAATLTPEQMETDATIRWNSYTPQQQVLYSKRGAAMTAANWATGLVSGVSLLAAILLAIRREWQPAFGKITVIALILGLFSFASGYLALPKIQVRVTILPRILVRHDLEELGWKAISKWEAAPPKSLSEARASAEQAAKPTTENRILGGYTREEDSPGNFLIRQSTNGFEFVWFDADGGEHVVQKKD